MIKHTLIILILTYTSVYAENTPEMDSLFQLANNLYSQEKYEEAIEKYLEIRNAGFESPELYFNTGNAYFRSNKLGKARLFYERAALLNPSDKDIQANLKYSEGFLTDKFEIIPEMFYKRWYRNLENSFNSNGWLVFSLIFFGIFLVSAAVYIFLPGVKMKKAGFFSGVCFFLLTLFTFIFSVRRYHLQENPNTAVVMDGTVAVKSAPRESGKDLFILHEGTKVWLENDIDEWIEIHISDGRKGWVRNTSLENI